MAAYPLALPPPTSVVTVLDEAMIERACRASRESPRGRIILPFHRSDADVCHRMLNAVQPGSYIRPHRHAHPPKAESLVLLRGALRFLVFGDKGEIADAVTVRGGEAIGVDVAPGVFHTFVALEPDTVVFEAKTGPYDGATDKEFASWAPPEGTPEAAAWLRRVLGDVAVGGAGA